MLKYLPLFILFTSCASLGIKSSDSIEQAEMKVVDVIEKEAGIIHPEAEPPMTTPVFKRKPDCL